MRTFRVRKDASARSDKGSGCSSARSLNSALIAIDTVALLFPAASLNGVSIRVGRFIHTSRRVNVTFDSHSSVPLATANTVASIAFPMSPTVQRCVYAYAYTCSTGNPSSIAGIGRRHVASAVTSQFSHLSELLRQRADRLKIF